MSAEIRPGVVHVAGDAVVEWPAERVLAILELLIENGHKEKIRSLPAVHQFSITLPPQFANDVKNLLYDTKLYEKDKSADVIMRCDCCKFQRYSPKIKEDTKKHIKRDIERA